MNKNLAKAKAIERKNRERLLRLNPDLDDNPGIYFFYRISEENEREIYIGQARHLCQRCCQHMVGYQQHIDLSLRAHKLYSKDNPHGYKLSFIHCPVDNLDEMEKYFIKLYSDNGCILKNKTAGGQGQGKEKIADYRPAKGYHDGIRQGRKSLAKEILHIIDTHLTVTLKPGKENNKVSIRALEKFWELLKGEEDGQAK